MKTDNVAWLYIVCGLLGVGLMFYGLFADMINPPPPYDDGIGETRVTILFEPETDELFVSDIEQGPIVFP